MLNTIKGIPASKDFYNRIIIFVTLILYALPILLDLLLNGWKRVFFYFAADTFYYLDVARNFSRSSFFTFDGMYPTNGFHPLWQLTSALIYEIREVLNFPDSITLVIVLLVCLLAICGSIIFFGHEISRSRSSLSPLFVFLPVGFYAIGMVFTEPRFGSLWSMTNGMETALLLLFYGLLIHTVNDSDFLLSKKSIITSGLVMSGFMLSRLDHGIFLMALFIMFSVYILCQKKWQCIKGLFIAFCMLFVIISIYLWLNYYTTGMLLPVSGTIKSSFPNPVEGLGKINEISLLLTTYQGVDIGRMIWRYTQMIIPMAVALPLLIIWIIKLIKGNLDRLTFIWCFSSFGVVGLGLYNFFYVPTYDQGHWYYPVSILFVSLVTIDFLSKMKASYIASNVQLVICSIACLVFYMAAYHNFTHNKLYVDLYNERTQLQAHYNSRSPYIVEYDDGIIAYVLEIPTMSGFGFNLDKEAALEAKEHRLLDLAYERGYRYLASSYYFGYEFTKDTTSDEIMSYLTNIRYFIHQTELDDYIFSIDYASIDGNIVIIEVEKSSH